MDGEVLIDIVDVKTMLAHHTITWDILNTGDEDIPGCDFAASSIIRRSIKSINFRAADGSKNLLEVKPILDQPYTKAFAALFRQPLAISERTKVVIEYDWEEPDRGYVYSVQFPHDQFGFRLLVPWGLEIHPSVKKTGFTANVPDDDKQIQQAIEVQEIAGKRAVEWKTSNVTPPSGIRLQW